MRYGGLPVWGAPVEAFAVWWSSGQVGHVVSGLAAKWVIRSWGSSDSISSSLSALKLQRVQEATSWCFVVLRRSRKSKASPVMSLLAHGSSGCMAPAVMGLPAHGSSGWMSCRHGPSWSEGFFMAAFSWSTASRSKGQCSWGQRSFVFVTSFFRCMSLWESCNLSNIFTLLHCTTQIFPGEHACASELSWLLLTLCLCYTIKPIIITLL